MADGTKIEWADATVNAINGCSLASPGCTNCYAMRLAGTRLRNHPSREGLTQPSKAGPVWNGTIKLSESALLQPLKWQRPRVIFWNAHGDPFYERVPNGWINRMFAVMALTPQHKHLVLTKRPARMRTYLLHPDRARIIARVVLDMAIADPSLLKRGNWPVQTIGDVDAPDDVTVAFPMQNVWLGTSAEDQPRLNERALDLLNTPPGFGLFLSLEPLLGPVDPTRVCVLPQVEGSPRAGIHVDILNGRYVESGRPYIGEWEVDGPYPAGAPCRKIDGVIVGGESGPGARPMHPNWAIDIRDDCDEAGVDFHFKQWGDWAPGENALKAQTRTEHCASWWDDRWDYSTLTVRQGEELHRDDEPDLYRFGKRGASRHLDGELHDNLPWRRAS